MEPEITNIKGDNSSLILFSVLIPSIEERKNTFLKRLLLLLEPQIEDKQVEICIISDNGEMSIGSKRNMLIDISKGLYFAFIDDDDLISSNYIENILEQISYSPDSIVFDAWVTLNGKNGKVCKYGIEYHYNNSNDAYYRLPNHLMVHKKSNVENILFLNVNYGEDDEWAARVKNSILKQVRINKVLYYYQYSTFTSRSGNNKSR